MTTTIIGYSRLHFDPLNVAAPHRYSSAGALAGAVYEAARSCSDEVHYLDTQTPSEWPDIDHVTSLICIESGFMDLVRKYSPKRSLLFAVNQEIHTAANKLLAPVACGDLPVRAILGRHELGGRDPRPVMAADKILLVGDSVTYGTYVSLRDSSDLHVVSYGYESPAISTKSAQTRDSIVLLASSIGVRKGSDLIAELCETIQTERLYGVRVAATGVPTNGYWRNQIKTWSTRYPETFDYLGWLTPTSIEYQSLMRRALCAVVPSREEGLVGTAIEAIRMGIPTLATVQCGLGPRPHELVLLDHRRTTWPSQIAGIVRRLLEGPVVAQPAEWTPLSSLDQVKRAVERFVKTGEVVPEYFVEATDSGLCVGRQQSQDTTALSTWIGRNSRNREHQPQFEAIVAAIAHLESHPTTSHIRVAFIDPCLENMPSDLELTQGAMRPKTLMRMGVSEPDSGSGAVHLRIGVEPLAAIEKELPCGLGWSARVLRTYVVRVDWITRIVSRGMRWMIRQLH